MATPWQRHLAVPYKALSVKLPAVLVFTGVTAARLVSLGFFHRTPGIINHRDINSGEMACIGLLVKWRCVKLTACCIPRCTAYNSNRSYSWLRPKTHNPNIVRPRSTRTSAEPKEQVNSFDAGSNIHLDSNNIDETTRPNVTSKIGQRARANVHYTGTPGKTKTMQLSKIDLTFSDTKEAYRSKTIYEIFRALLVLKLCQIDTLVEKNKQVCYLHKLH